MPSTFTQVALAVSPVFAVSIAIAVLNASGLGFPLALSIQAWPHWLIFSSLVFCAMSVMQSLVGFAFRPRTGQPGKTAA